MPTMSPIDVDELLARPLKAMNRLRTQFGGGTTGGNPEGHHGVRIDDKLVAKAVSDALCTGAAPALTRVPVLSQKALAEGKLPPNSLVRYSGMVQDQYEPEYFVGSFAEVNVATGERTQVNVKYLDNITQRQGFVNDFDGADARIHDRLPLYCVPVPGRTPWARASPEVANELESSSLPRRQETQPKRARDLGADAMDCTNEDMSNTRSANDHTADLETQPLAKRTHGGSRSLAGRAGAGEASRTEDHSAAADTFRHDQELGLDGLACLVKMYHCPEGELKLNDTAEFVGVLGYDQFPREEEDGEGASNHLVQGLAEFSRKIPPPSLAPRLHCIFHRILPKCEPLLVDPKHPRDALYALQGTLPFSAFVREKKRQAIAHLANALDGDALAAEYSLLTLLSRAYQRTESLAPGSLSVNLRGMTAENVPRFAAAVANLVPKCVTIPVTTKSLSEKFKFAPKKDYEADRLMLSNLQLSDGTVVLLDETKLEPGQIGSDGVSNLSALKSLVTLQKIPYDFGFYKMDFEVDHPTLTLSRRGSVFATGAAVPVRAGEGFGPVPDNAALEGLRVYVEATRRTELTLDESSSAFAEEDFVRARQQGHALTGEDFHRMLTVARLTALSLGDGTMDASHWSHMKALEANVAERLKEASRKGGSADNSRPALPSDHARGMDQ